MQTNKKICERYPSLHEDAKFDDSLKQLQEFANKIELVNMKDSNNNEASSLEATQRILLDLQASSVILPLLNSDYFKFMYINNKVVKQFLMKIMRLLILDVYEKPKTQTFKLLKQLMSLDFDPIDFDFTNTFAKKLYGSFFLSLKEVIQLVVKENFWNMYELGSTLISYIIRSLTLDELMESEYLKITIEYIANSFDTSRYNEKIHCILLELFVMATLNDKYGKHNLIEYISVYDTHCVCPMINIIKSKTIDHVQRSKAFELFENLSYFVQSIQTDTTIEKLNDTKWILIINKAFSQSIGFFIDALEAGEVPITADIVINFYDFTLYTMLGLPFFYLNFNVGEILDIIFDILFLCMNGKIADMSVLYCAEEIIKRSFKIIGESIALIQKKFYAKYFNSLLPVWLHFIERGESFAWEFIIKLLQANFDVVVEHRKIILIAYDKSLKNLAFIKGNLSIIVDITLKLYPIYTRNLLISSYKDEYLVFLNKIINFLLQNLNDANLRHYIVIFYNIVCEMRKEFPNETGDIFQPHIVDLFIVFEKILQNSIDFQLSFDSLCYCEKLAKKVEANFGADVVKYESISNELRAYVKNNLSKMRA